jgi:Glycosyl hydrolase family 26
MADQRAAGLRQWGFRLGRLLVAAVAAVGMISGTPLRTGAVQSAPAPILWGAFIDGVPWDAAKLAAFEARTKPVSIIHFGQGWSRAGVFQAFPAKDFQTVRDHGSIPMLAWGSWDYCCGVDQPMFSLASITRGDHDAYLIEWARAARAWNHPFFLRFDWEMNGWWQFPWAEQINGNQPGDYVRAWRHVHDIFVQQGATNATWVWCPNIASPGTTPVETLYPGDTYVDWVGMDGYNFGTDKGNQWQSFSQVFAGSAYNSYQNTYAQLLKLAPTKPMMIAETGTSRNGGDPGAWIHDALLEQLPNKFPQIRALVWFNWNDGDPNLSWPIESAPATLEAFTASIRSDYFASNSFAHLDAGQIASPGWPGQVGTVAIGPVSPGAADDLTALAAQPPTP